ncbi:Asp-tRNA(Asn)/Glu-tRNA(Gln) amidotransferase subunit GatA [Puniceicoccales bacterium CK1056]|uniref:Glutamyl-tRNA(Gln) amidotransferase subunit A n=1 Tax=Oceanipulchritudo coccoides TaxID=2706888 RepID=A0A6B2M1M0_9BACT|nr:Asp-tRNA(Asn)/Glu-tRNA(Gln) amidotransferase subunit GatA [Oceanipulchritudo coccoides]NDV62242.1 Asp-tRNA(Asn)/Glu-tRNA(Gln) amidotransferase subunit GatA [Oceanipulchritudo coccoides]
MDTEGILEASAIELGKALHKGKVSSVEICTALADQVEAIDPEVGAFLTLDREKVLEAAAASDARREKGKKLSPIDGIPVGIKDVMAIEGEPLTCASRILEKFNSPYTGTVGNKLLSAGLIPFGRLNMDEFAMGSSTENSAVKKTRNPWNTEHAPGGSSGGSAAAVAARECPWSLGSDTGGSIRQPAAFCGVVGLKPTYGRVSRFGLAAFASSLDQIGPMGRSIDDVATLLDVISGPDPLDSTSWPEKLEAASVQLHMPDEPRKLGIPEEYFGEGIQPEVRSAVEEVIEVYRTVGYKIKKISLPHTGLAVPTYYIIATAEASSNLARYDGIRYTHRSPKAVDGIDLYYQSRGEGFGQEVKRRIILGSYVLSSGYYDAYYKRAQQVRTLIRNDFLKAFGEVDAILTPTTPSPAFQIGEKVDDPISMYLADIFTISVNLAGLPGLSMPCGLSESGLPIGFQLIGQPFAEGNLLQTGKAYEIAQPFKHRPALVTNNGK